jgi:signal peptidase I
MGGDFIKVDADLSHLSRSWMICERSWQSKILRRFAITRGTRMRWRKSTTRNLADAGPVTTLADAVGPGCSPRHEAVPAHSKYGVADMVHDMKRRRRHLSRSAFVIGLALVASVVIAGYGLYLGPAGDGGPAIYRTVRGISMTPTLHDGDLVIAAAQSHYSRGDIVMFRVPAGQPYAGLAVTHRIVGGNATSGFVTEGDNNHGTDPWRIKPTDLLGKLRFTVPRLGGWVAGGPAWVPSAAIALSLVGLLLLVRHMSRTNARHLVPSR